MRLKRWERKKCKPNSLPLLHKMHVNVDEVSQIFKHNSSVLVKEINLKTTHVKSKEEGEPGQIIKIYGFTTQMLCCTQKNRMWQVELVIKSLKMEPKFVTW